MRFAIVQELHADVDAVDAALVDPAFLVRMADLPKLGSAEVVSQSRAGDVVHQDVRYLFQAPLSAAVTRVVDPDRLTWVERSVCDLSVHRTTCAIIPDHYGGLMAGRYEATIVAATGLTRRTITGELKVRMPLVGGKVEQAIVGGIEENAVAQATLLDQYLAG
ncbi:MAG: DUF2505 family protein [Acidimicrobiia bacterium]